MPFISEGPLEEMINPDAVPHAMKKITGDVGTFMQREIKRNTPVDTNPYRSRKDDRPRGALRESIEKGPVMEEITNMGVGFSIRVFTRDPLGPLVEWPTRAHIIRPKKPGGTLAWRNQKTGEWIHAKKVRHPGTKGAHMFALGALKTEVSIEVIARPAMREFGHDLVSVF